MTMKQHHGPWDVKKFTAGANTDVDPVLVARTESVYRDARNMRLRGGVLHKVGGEYVQYTPDAIVQDPQSYRCVGAITVKGRIVEFWASTVVGHPPLVRVDGVVVAMSPDIPYSHDKQLVLVKREDCEGGIVFDARSGAVPLHWNIGHLLSEHAAGHDTYFDGFDISQVQANPVRPVNRPVFLGLDPVGDGGGLPPGQIWYAIRMANVAGDRTPPGPMLGPVMVPWTSELWSDTVPSAGITGASPTDAGSASGFGARLRLRVNNKAHFDTVELIRYRWTDQVGTDAAPVTEVAWRKSVQAGMNEVFDIVDKGETLAPVAGDDADEVVYYIQRAEAVEYVDYRLVYGNVSLGGRDVAGELIGDPGDRLVPFTRSLGVTGHSDPVNNCYYRRFQSGERHGVGVVYYGPNGGQSFVQIIEDEVQMPDRRDPKTGLSLAISDAPCHAANTLGQVSPTYEVFDIDNARGKSLSDPLVNIMSDGRRRAGGWSGQSVLAGSPSGISEDGVFLDSAADHGPWYKSSYTKAFRPTRPDDGKWGLDYKVNIAVRPAGRPNDTEDFHPGLMVGSLPYDPKVWGCGHHTLGLGFRGIQDVPEGMQGFSVVATPPAGRVVTQGLLKWDLTGSPEPGTPVTKALFKAHLCLPDFNAGLVGQRTWEDMQENPGKYKLQLVSPLGFTTEQYGSAMTATDPGLNQVEAHVGGISTLADLLSVARVLWDTGQANPGNTTGGISPAAPLPPVSASGGPPDHFTAFARWRNTDPVMVGDMLFGLTSVEEIAHEGGARSLRVEMDTQIYNTPSTGGSSGFQDPGTKAFHEPWYVVNIVRDGVHVDLDGGFRSCNHYQAFISEIGRTGGDNTFRLADENPDDYQGYVHDGVERYIWIRTPSGLQRWMNREGYSLSEVGALITQIDATGQAVSPHSGETIQGIYEVGGGDGPDIKLLSGVPDGCSVEVRYDNRIVSKVYGDMVTAPAIATIVDARASAVMAGGLWGDTQAGSGPVPVWPIGPGWYNGGLATHGTLPVPFANYEYNGRYMVPFGMGWGFPMPPPGSGPVLSEGSPRWSVSQIRSGQVRSIRQWKVLFDCEVRAPLYLSRHEQDGDRSWPNINYVPRPYNFNPGAGLEANGVFPGYADVYGAEEQSTWGFGGFKTSQRPVSDYSVAPQVAYFRKPVFGYEEQEDLCSAVIWSRKATPLLQDSPGLKTFPASNIEFIPDSKGSLQFLWSAASGNLFAIMEEAVYEVLISKSTAYSADGSEFSMFAQDNFVGQVIPRSLDTGMLTGGWRTAARGRSALFWYNSLSAFRLGADAALPDIAVDRYRKGLAIADLAPAGPPLPKRACAAYDLHNDELYLRLNDATVMLGGKDAAWFGTTDHQYDAMVYANGRMYGMRGLTTYLLDEGDVLNGSLVMASVKVPSAPHEGERMQWLRVKVDSPRKPLRIEWYDQDDQLVAWMDEATFGRLYLKKQTGWENWVPRKNTAVDPRHGELQGDLAYYKIIWQEAGADRVVMSAAQVKALK